MRVSRACTLTVVTFLAVGCNPSARDASRQQVARALTETFGEDADPQIAFERDSSHLLVFLATVAFPTVSEDALTERSQKIASSALRHYDRASELDSVTVQYREPVRKGMWWIRHTRTFSVDYLKSMSSDAEESASAAPDTR